MELQLKELIIVQFLILLFRRINHGTATFDPTDDSVYEGNETAIVAITGVTSVGSASEDGTQSKTITITENDSAQVTLLVLQVQ